MPFIRIKSYFLEIPLTKQRNLQFDYPVPNDVKDTSNKEFESIRYTAITCDPDEFVGKKYSIRQIESKRKTEIMIVITMYNEHDTLFIKTMTSVIKNVDYICSKWPESESWKKIVVLIVADGRNKVNKQTLNVLSAMGCYQDRILQNRIGRKLVTAHLFEYTTQLMVDSDFKIHKNILPVQIMLCLKEKNAKKLNSHRWSFNAFAALLKPNISFDSNHNVGSACGEIKVDLGRKCRNLLNPLVASLNFEYKMSNILDKPSESVFGYISVLPGAFSAPLEAYFKEDRILSFEPVTKKHEKWIIKYIKLAKAETDVPDNVPEFISQRPFYSIAKFTYIWNSGQPFYCKILLQIQFFYNGLQLIFNWFSLSTTSNSATDLFKGYGNTIFDIARSLYLIIIVIIFICSIGDNINLGNLNGALLNKEDMVKIDVIEDEDLNAAYMKIINELKNKGQSHEEKQHRNALTKKNDYYRLFRTYLVLLWIFTNGFVILLFTSNTFTRYFSTYDYYSGAYNPYLAFGWLFI
ncbi:9001_t:CDS:2 [Gigaspora margarita]|uniref:Chitin synthase n=1 Tax=Gigaspora margarita TaxID=4874 RepID=A0ABM8W4R3_GIGMA|nr:9001_t:CDS:2 [Gigaspora margarita]